YGISRRSLHLDVGRPDHLAPLWGESLIKSATDGARLFSNCSAQLVRAGSTRAQRFRLVAELMTRAGDPTSGSTRVIRTGWFARRCLVHGAKKVFEFCRNPREVPARSAIENSRLLTTPTLAVGFCFNFQICVHRQW